MPTFLTEAFAVATDAADEFARRAGDRGVDVDARLHDAIHLLERLTAPDTMRVLNTLMDRLPQLEQLLKAADAAQATHTPVGLVYRVESAIRVRSRRWACCSPSRPSSAANSMPAPEGGPAHGHAEQLRRRLG